MHPERREYEPMLATRGDGWGKMLKDLMAGRRQVLDELAREVAVSDRMEYGGSILARPAPKRSDAELMGLYALKTLLGLSGPYLNDDSPISQILTQLIISEQRRAAAVTRFGLAGRHVVHFAAGITAALGRTDAIGMKAADIRLPWDAFYLAFDDVEDEAWNRSGVDGILIARGDGSMDAGKLSILVVNKSNKAHYGGPMPDMAKGTSEAFRNHGWALNIRLDDDRDLSDALQADARAFGRFDTPMMAGDADGTLREHYRQQMAVLPTVAHLLTNALLYLTAEPEGESERWQTGAPAKLVEKAEASDKRGTKAENELYYMGWTRVRYVGSDEAESGATVAAHWVRGHWRRQPYGTGSSLRKIIWIRPYVAGGTAEEANLTGRVHQIA